VSDAEQGVDALLMDGSIIHSNCVGDIAASLFQVG
jgi:hypothetical protein